MLVMSGLIQRRSQLQRAGIDQSRNDFDAPNPRESRIVDLLSTDELSRHSQLTRSNSSPAGLVVESVSVTATIQRQLLDDPWDPDLWKKLSQDHCSELTKKLRPILPQEATVKASEILSYTNLLIADQQQAAQKQLDSLKVKCIITLAEWQLLKIARDLWLGCIDSVNKLSQDFLAKQPKGSSLALACYHLMKSTAQGCIDPTSFVAVLGNAFGFEPGRSQDDRDIPVNKVAAVNKSENISVYDRPGWNAVLACTENDPEARFLLRYYLFVLDGPVSVPCPKLCKEYPVISVIIPVYNLWPLLQNCLKRISDTANSIEFEVIVADDCSTDDTMQLLMLNPWVRHIRMETNGRFIRNCNNAARYARGKYIYFLNNDTVVLDHWLDHIIATFKRRPEAGVVGSQVLFYSDEIQESGGIIWPDGNAWNFGRNLVKEKLCFVNYSREVDFVSGCALAVRRDLWEQLLDFGEEFIPAYCVDSDLCYKIRSLGKEVWVQPQSKIIHFEGLSNSKDTKVGLKQYQIANSLKLLQKWKLPILTRGLSDTTDILHASNYRLRTHKTVLLVDHYVPQPDKDAGSRTVQAFCEALINLGYNVIFLPENFTDHQPYTSNLETLGVMVLYGSYVANHLKQVLQEQLRIVDCIFFNRPHITKRYIDMLTEIFPKAKTLYYMHDMHGLREHLEKSYSDIEPGTPVSITEADLLTPDEEMIIRKVDMALTCSPKEQALLLRSYTNVAVICPYAMQITSETLADLSWNGNLSMPKDLLFVGGFKHAPNRIGIEWLLNRVLPLLPQDLTIHVVGSHCSNELKDKLESNPLIKFHGFISDTQLQELLRHTAVSLAPLPYGAGIKGKVVEAFAAGHTVIGSEYGIEGMEDAPSEIYFRCASPQDYIAAIEQVFSRSRSDWIRASTRSQTYVLERFNLNRIEIFLRDTIGMPIREVSEIHSLLNKLSDLNLLGCMLMASSYGLDQDHWLLQNNLLVLSVQKQINAIVITGYLPNTDNVIYNGSMEVFIKVLYNNNEQLSLVHPMQLGMNELPIHFSSCKKVSIVAIELIFGFRIESPRSVDTRSLAMLVNRIEAI